ncbi:MAG: MarR family EPS-associated transcriptional regulator [Thermodesulfatator sp.]|nr:MAG: MarR family EPS-associated transcriptional regulator [Thermodesulfatator sp.]
MLDDGLRYKLLSLLQENPDMTQRAIAQSLGISLGKVNYCIRALMSKGWLKVREFYRDGNKKAYSYILTPDGIEEKARVTLSFLKRKMKEYEEIQKEIKKLQKEVKRFQERD